MKKILFSLLIFMISCQNNDLESKKKKLDNLKNSLVETYSEIEKLEKEITLLDSNFIQKNYDLVFICDVNSLISKKFFFKRTARNWKNLSINARIIKNKK